MAYIPPTLPYYGPVAHDSGPGNLPPERIVIHGTAGPGQTCCKGAQGTAGYFKQQAARGSAHYITDLDESIQCVKDNIIAWHAPPNQYSLGIEMECSLDAGGQGHWVRADHITMMHRTAKLVAQKCLQYGIPIVKLSAADLLAGKHGVCGHVDVSQAFHQSDHTDPGPYFPWAQFMAWVREEAAALAGTPTPAPTPAPKDGFTVAEADRVITELKQYISDTERGTEGDRYAQIINEGRGREQRIIAAINASTKAITDAIATLKAKP